MNLEEMLAAKVAEFEDLKKKIAELDGARNSILQQALEMQGAVKQLKALIEPKPDKPELK